jgi:hypothetical protein
MKSEKVILQCICDQLDKLDLVLRREPDVFFFDLPPRYLGLRH